MASAFEDEQRQLCQLWKKARKDGRMTPWQQATAYGLNEAWRETSASYYSRLKRICREINAEYDVDGLCRKWPERIAQLIRNEGSRLTN